MPQVGSRSKKSTPRSAALVYRHRRGRIEFLFISAASDPQRLVLPGGRVGRIESPEEAAVRETSEEAGVRVAIASHLGSYRHRKRSGARPRTALFLAEMLADGRPRERRRRVWLAPDEMKHSQIALPPKALRLIHAAPATMSFRMAA